MTAKGRKGKTVTIVAGLHNNPETMGKVARILKQQCGAGGTVKEGAIEIQGDNTFALHDTFAGNGETPAARRLSGRNEASTRSPRRALDIGRASSYYCAIIWVFVVFIHLH